MAKICAGRKQKHFSELQFHAKMRGGKRFLSISILLVHFFLSAHL